MFHFRSLVVGATFAFALLLYCTSDDTGSSQREPEHVDVGGDSSGTFDLAGLDLEIGSEVGAEDGGTDIDGAEDGGTDIAGLTSRIEALEAALLALAECPTDMVKISDFCIEIDERPAKMWGPAAAACLAQDRRLCSVEEIFPMAHPIAAMQEIEAQLEHYTDNREWTADFADPYESGSTPSTIVTMNGAGHTGSELGTTATAFRCCVNILP